MHIAGIIENSNTQEILDTIKYLLNTENRKVNFTEYGYFRNREAWNNYCSAVNQTGTEILIIKIKASNIEEALNIIPLDILIINDYNEWAAVSDIICKNKRFYKNLTIILNGDIIKISNFSDEELCRVLCYGFNKDSNITTSSTGEPSISGRFLCCIQTALTTVNGNKIEPQEYVINMDSTTADPYNILAAASFAVLNDVNLNGTNGNN